MSHKFFREGYLRNIRKLLSVSKEKQDYAAAVGGHFDAIGYLEKTLLVQHGLKPTDYLIDIGCGSGRLLSQLNEQDVKKYLGTDISGELLEHAEQYIGNHNFRLKQVDGCVIPEDDSCVDMICMFSVITHLLPQESFLYFKECARVLKNNGLLVVSFLEFKIPDLWPVFEASIATTLDGNRLDMFIDRDALSSWALHSGFEVIQFLDGNKPHIVIDKDITFDNGVTVSGLARLGPIGQSVAIFKRSAQALGVTQ